MAKEEIDKKLKFKEAWLTGKEMLQWGFADGVIGKERKVKLMLPKVVQ